MNRKKLIKNVKDEVFDFKEKTGVYLSEIPEKDFAEWIKQKVKKYSE